MAPAVVIEYEENQANLQHILKQRLRDLLYHSCDIIQHHRQHSAATSLARLASTKPRPANARQLEAPASTMKISAKAASSNASKLKHSPPRTRVVMNG